MQVKMNLGQDGGRFRESGGNLETCDCHVVENRNKVIEENVAQYR